MRAWRGTQESRTPVPPEHTPGTRSGGRARDEVEGRTEGIGEHGQAADAFDVLGRHEHGGATLGGPGDDGVAVGHLEIWLPDRLDPGPEPLVAERPDPALA